MVLQQNIEHVHNDLFPALALADDLFVKDKGHTYPHGKRLVKTGYETSRAAVFWNDDSFDDLVFCFFHLSRPFPSGRVGNQ